MSDQARPKTARPAFAGDRVRHLAGSGIRAAAWAGTAVTLRALAKPGAVEARSPPTADPPPKGAFRDAWTEAFRKDAADVADGVYPPMDEGVIPTRRAVEQVIDLFEDARGVDARRRRRDGTEARAETPSAAYPTYYRQNFHYQTGGWFTSESARRYETQVETLFAGAAGPMRRRALSLLARHLKTRDQRGLRILDLACGSGAFLGNLQKTFPRAALTGVDLSAAYLEEAARHSDAAALVQGKAERLPIADDALDAVTCVYLFHELPPKVRLSVAAEIARVLRAGGVLAFADSIQPTDAPGFARVLETFPAYFHEPFYSSYAATDLDALFGDTGLRRVGADQAFLTKAVLYEKIG